MKIESIKHELKDKLWLIILAIPFILIDTITRGLGNSIGFYKMYSIGPNLFTLLYCVLFIGIVANLKEKAAKVVYLFWIVLWNVVFITQLIYYNLTNFYFSFQLMQMAGEGSGYVLDTIIKTPITIYALIAGEIVVSIICFRKGFQKAEDNWLQKNQYGKILLLVGVFCVLHMLIPFSLGKANTELKWNSFRNARNIYNTYSDSNKSLRVSGIYEYTIRNFYVVYLKPTEKMTDEEAAFLEQAYEEKEKKANAYTGICEGKNVIFLQLEGIDSWLLTEDTMPNLYTLMKESYQFDDHYSMYTGGGSTFNSEFAVNTGFTTPITYGENVYTLNKNQFPNTMAKLFKERNYTVNAFHMNTSEFYSRGINYKNWGYDGYYGLADLPEVNTEDEAFELDRALIENETFYQKMFPKDQLFVDYIITYTPHTPFTATKGVGKLLAEKNGVENAEELSEEEVVRMEAGETDLLVKKLMDALKTEGLYENTVLVVFADHYLYTINDKSVLDQYKITEDNRINHTPFFIWSSEIADKEEEKIFHKTNMQLHILPTVLNLFGIEYNPNDYLGLDIMDPENEGISFFTDQSWYDGERYVSGSTIVDGAPLSEAELKKKNEEVMNLIHKNDLTLKYNYFSR